ncbi:MAG: hypothetical protein E2O72_03850 [Candidatus Dadabacteria bacterium]|nr:hypothetical protein [Candidatus Dadabacteria bacterium]TDI90561.1 MAG: hypothetical protein E2O72_03850 [Candidatus Dadabacteria bacterium]
MKKLLYLTIVILAFGFVYVGTVISGDSTDQAAKLWSSIQDAKYQDNWALWPGKGKMYKAQPPHGAFLTTYINETAANALKAGVKEMPKGSIIIKENYMPDKKLAAITVMNKTGDGKDDYFWVKYMPDGTVAKKEVEKDGKKMSVPVAGTPKGCVGCHVASVGGIYDIMTPPK